jgi:hypothetical protein
MTQEMKKLLKEFKTYLKEEENYNTKFDEAIAVIKTVMEEFPLNPDTPEDVLLGQIETILNFADYYKKTPILPLNTDEDFILAQRKISNKFVQQQIGNILTNMGLNKEAVSNFIDFLNQKGKTPEQMAKADSEMRKRELEKAAAEEEMSMDITSGDIAPLPQQNKTVTGRKATPRPVSGLKQSTPEESDVAAYRKKATGNTTKP